MTCISAIELKSGTTFYVYEDENNGYRLTKDITKAEWYNGCQRAAKNLAQSLINGMEPKLKALVKRAKAVVVTETLAEAIENGLEPELIVELIK